MKPATIISIVSIVIALATFYLTQLRGPNLIPSIGPTIKAYHAGEDELVLLVPVTIMNKSSAEGSVERAAVTLYREDTSNQRFFIAWHRFATYRYEVARWVLGDIAHALPIHGDSSLVRLVTFLWDKREKLYLKAGNYVLIFHYWESGEERPKNSEHRFLLTTEMAEKLEEYRVAKDNMHINITLDKQMDSNKEMTEHEFKKLLGG